MRGPATLLLLTALAMSGGEAGAATQRSLVVAPVEVEGDTSDPSRAAEWAARAALLTGALKQELNAADLYRVVDDAAAADLLERNRQQREVHACTPCVVDLAGRLGAERVLSAWVFRVSNLILTLHLEVRDGATGEPVIRRNLDFRGDNDRSWLKAGSYFVRWLREDAPERR